MSNHTTATLRALLVENDLRLESCSFPGTAPIPSQFNSVNQELLDGTRLVSGLIEARITELNRVREEAEDTHADHLVIQMEARRKQLLGVQELLTDLADECLVALREGGA